MGEKASLNIGKRYWLIVLKGKSYSYTNTKSIFRYALIIWSIIWNSFFLLLYFFNLSLFSCFSFLVLLPLNPFLCYILWFCTLFSIHVWVRCWEFLCPLSPLLEPSTFNCKAACLLFRHHLHINTARELAGQHLMRR